MQAPGVACGRFPINWPPLRQLRGHLARDRTQKTHKTLNPINSLEAVQAVGTYTKAAAHIRSGVKEVRRSVKDGDLATLQSVKFHRFMGF